MAIRLLLLLTAGVCGMDFTEPEPTPDLHSLFVSLKEYGIPKLLEMQKEHPYLKQYLVAAVLRPDEFNRANEWSSADMAVLEEETRVNMYINEVRGGKKPFHGEMMFLLDKGGLEDMAAIVRVKAGEEAVPVVVLYSFYIPCAHISKLEYSCSEELAREATSRNYPMFVAFSEVFEQTSRDSSMTYMALGNIKVFVEGTLNTKFTYIPNDRSEDGGIFQIQYINCLKQMGIADCDSKEIEQAVQVQLVNSVVYFCTKDSIRAGMLTQYNRHEFVKCVASIVDECNSCNRCPQQVIVKFVFQFCAVSVLRPGLAFGRAQTVDDSEWQRYEGPWAYVIITPPEFSTLQSLPCNTQANALKDCLNTLKKDADSLPDMYALSSDIRGKISEYFKTHKKKGKGKKQQGTSAEKQS